MNTTLLIVIVSRLVLSPAGTGNSIRTGEPRATPTFECVGIELPFSGDEDRDSYCDILFRINGTGNWKQGLRLYADHYTDRKGFRGSIVHLEPGTEYDIRLTCHDPDGGGGSRELTVTTWSESFPVGETVKVESRRTPLEVRSGSPGAYRLYEGSGSKATVDVNDAQYCVNIEDKSYIILRNICFRESDDHAIRIENSHHIIIEDCEIVNWGRPGAYRKDSRPKFQHAAVQIESGEQIIIQHNYIHDPRGTALDWRTRHPIGPRGIYFRGPVRHSVFRYNRITGKPDHYYQDIITGGSQGPDSDVDVYGNEVSHTWDDGIEIEGNNINIRVWNNVVHQSYKGLASDNNDHTYYGPVYIWRNVFTDLFLSPGSISSSDGFKLENEVGRGGIYLFNNTILGSGRHSVPRGGISNGPVFNLLALNNIFDVGNNAYRDNLEDGSFLDHNGYTQERDELSPNLREGWEKNGLFGHRFEYVGPEGWTHYLAPGNAAVDAGTIINNFADQFAGRAPDLGSCEKGYWSMQVGPHADELKE